MTEVATVAAADHEAQIAGLPLPWAAVLERLTLESTADTQILLVLRFIAGARAQLPPHLGALLQRVAVVGSAPRHELVRDEVAVAVVDDGARRAVLELEVRGVVPRD